MSTAYKSAKQTMFRTTNIKWCDLIELNERRPNLNYLLLISEKLHILYYSVLPNVQVAIYIEKKNAQRRMKNIAIAIIYLRYGCS